MKNTHSRNTPKNNTIQKYSSVEDGTQPFSDRRKSNSQMTRRPAQNKKRAEEIIQFYGKDNSNLNSDIDMSFTVSPGNSLP